MSGGLSSREAQQRLHNELREFTKRKSKVNWLREIKRCPFTLVSSAQTTVGGLLLIAYFIGLQIAPLQGVVLLTMALLNFALFCRDVHVVKTRRVNNLLSKIMPYFNQNCPWTPQSYPRSSISTERGLLTVPAYRDGSLVNLPTSLLVNGDIIQLNEGMPSPATVTLLKSDSDEIKVELGEAPPTHLYNTGRVSSLPKESISFVLETEPLKFKVTSTPIIDLLDTIIDKGRPQTYLTKEKTYTLRVLEVAVVVIYLVTLLWNIMRAFALPDDFRGSRPELLLGQPIYSVFPLLLLPLSVLWTIMNHYGTTRIIFLVHKENFSNSGRLKTLYRTVRQMLILFLNPARHPNYRCFHILGSLTSVCAMDKEYVLTNGYPLPEKVFFFRTENVEGEREERRENSEQGEYRDFKEEREEEGIKEEKHSESDEVGSPTIKIEVTETAENKKVTNTELEQPHNESPGLLRSNSETGKLYPSSTELDGNSDETQPLDSLPTDIGTSSPALSDASPFEIVTEILDLSPDLEHSSGISFDNVNWHSYSSSLKPIGVNILVSSHILQDPYSCNPVAFPRRLREHLHSTLCACSLGIEIGVSQFTSDRFDNEVLLNTIGEMEPDIQKSLTTKRANSAVLCNGFTVVHPHLISSVIRDKVTASHLLMSRGSGDMIASCCSDFWDGKDLQPMTNFERATILEFYNRRNFTSYCIALSYNPLLEVNLESLKSGQVNLFVPTCHTQNGTAISPAADAHSSTATLTKPEDVFGQLQCNQVFLGLVSLHFKPKRDIVDLIEDLQVAGVRFVHFTAENDVRGKVFAQKLGLEADWNCHISLAPSEGEGEESNEDTESNSSNGLLSRSSSTSSSLSSVFNNIYMSYNRARLPKGIDQVRPHLKHVDNVPLLVPLFTDCTTDTIREMIAILQENREIVLCLGNAWNRENLTIFAQADMSLSLVPEPVDVSSCTSMTETCALSTSNSSQNALSINVTKGWPTPLEMASYLNSTTCQLSFHRDADVGLLSLISESRHALSSIRLGLTFGLGSMLLLSSIMSLATLFFLPPPLSGSHLFWFTLLLVPLLSLTSLALRVDPRINSQMPNRKKKTVWNNRWFLLLNFILTFFLAAVFSVLLFGLTLLQICRRDITNSDCDYFLGDRNSSSSWNGWREEHEQGLVFAQDLTALFVSLNLVVLSIRFLHHTEPLWKLWKYVSWQYVLIAISVVVLQLFFFVISQTFIVHVYKRRPIASLNSVPVYVWVVGLLWLVALLPLQELLKYRHRKRFEHLQTHLKLEFETKLGMHSPV